MSLYETQVHVCKTLILAELRGRLHDARRFESMLCKLQKTNANPTTYGVIDKELALPNEPALVLDEYEAMLKDVRRSRSLDAVYYQSKLDEERKRIRAEENRVRREQDHKFRYGW